jgi:hypothetical protein
MVEIVFDSPNYARVVRWIETYGSKELRKEMTGAITKIAKDGILPDVKASVKGGRSGARGGGYKARGQFAMEKSTAKNRERAAAKAAAGAGLRDTIARGVEVSNRASGPRAGVRIIHRTSALPPDQKSLPRHMNRGRWRHPVFGDREAWVTQTFTPGWFDKPIIAKRPQVRAAIEVEFNKWVARAGEEMQKAQREHRVRK